MHLRHAVLLALGLTTFLRSPAAVSSSEAPVGTRRNRDGDIFLYVNQPATDRRTQRTAGKIGESDFWIWAAENYQSLERANFKNLKPCRALERKLREYRPDLGLAYFLPKDGVVVLQFLHAASRESLLAVGRLLESAPKAGQFRLIGFAPRTDDYLQPFGTQTGYDEPGRPAPFVRFDPTELWFSCHPNSGVIDLVFYFADFDSANNPLYKNGVDILLQRALGEQDSVLWRGRIEFRRLPADPRGAGLIPYPSIRDHFDAIKDALIRRPQ